MPNDQANPWQSLRVDNRALRELPVRTLAAADASGPSTAGACYLLLPAAPTPTLLPAAPPPPHLTLSVPSVLTSLGLRADPRDIERRSELYLSALTQPPFQPAAHVYAGHQLGFFAGLLGDGAALYLGEVVVGGRAGREEHQHPQPPQQQQRLELNLEGVPTPLSRPRTENPAPLLGRKTLLQASRELLTTELLAALGVPTTRCALLAYCYPPARDQQAFAVVLRCGASFLRLGSLEVCRGASAASGRAGPSSGGAGHPSDLLPRLVDHAVRRHFPEVWRAFGGLEEEDEDQEARRQREGRSDAAAPSSSPSFHLSADPELRADMVATFLGELSARVARLCALWQAHGFVHGSLGSDNLALSGETINAGARSRFLGGGGGEEDDGNAPPDELSFVGSPHPDDPSGMYSFGAQPSAARFALERLAEALGSASAMVAAGISLHQSAAAAAVAGGGAASDGALAAAAAGAMPGGVGPGRARHELARFDVEYERAYLEAMRRKLGLLSPLRPPGAEEEEEEEGEEGEDDAAALAAAMDNDEGDRALVRELLATIEATGAGYAPTMRRLSMVVRSAAEKRQGEGEGDDDRQEEDDDTFGGFLSADFLERELPSPSKLAAAIASSLPPEPNVRGLAGLARRDAAFAHSLGIPLDRLERLQRLWARAAELRSLGDAAKRREDGARWRAWLRRYRQRLREAGVGGCQSRARARAMDAAANPAYVLRERDLRAAARAAEEEGAGGGDGGAALRALLERVRRPFRESE